VTGSVRPIDRIKTARAALPRPGFRPTSPLRASGYPATAIPALVALLDELAGSAVRFCLWKSNLHLEAALSGETDLDLLVERAGADRFREIVARHGLLLLAPAPGAAYPAMEHHLGMDRASGRLFHLHVHFQLVLGERYVKNYRLPLENEFLASTRTLCGVAIPSAELDLTVLCLRALLKYRIRDLVKDVFGIRSPGIPVETQKEIAWLRGDADLPAITDRLPGAHARVPTEVVTRFLDVVARRPRHGLELFRLRARLRRTLRRQQRRRRLAATAGYVTSVLRRRERFVRRRYEPRMTPASGGLTVAIIGADGSGKTSVTTAIQRWLDWKLAARVFYMGSKEPSTCSRWSYVAFRALRRAGFSAGLRDTALACHHLSIGRDRARRHQRALQDANRGCIVLFDRFPAECISPNPDHRVLDGPQIAAVLGRRLGPLTRRLANAEERMYCRYDPPDVLIVLIADADVGATRKPDHDLTTIARKRRAAVEVADHAEAQGVHVIRIDANEAFDDVLRTTKVGLWDAM
jgi:hypothetical protein